MRKHKAYKVVARTYDDTLISSTMQSTEGRIIYRRRRIARPVSWLHGPLATFKTLRDAKAFKRTYGLWQEVWICCIKPSAIEQVCFPFRTYDLADRIIPLAMCRSELPDGTILADEVTLLRRVA